MGASASKSPQQRGDGHPPAALRHHDSSIGFGKPCFATASRAFVGCKEILMSELNEAQRDRLDEDKFAFPKERKEPLNDADHVRNAMARFNQVEGVSDDERDEAWSRIKRAAKKHGVEIHEKSWRELGKK